MEKLNVGPQVGSREDGELGKELRRIRMVQRLTLEDIQATTGLDSSTISRIERGQRHPDRDTVVTIALAGLSLETRDVNRILLLAGYAPLSHTRNCQCRSDS